MRFFITGASGWIGSAVVPELLSAGHQVVGLARSDASAAALLAAGAEVRRGSIDDLDTLRSAAEAADGVIHLAFKHDIAFSGGFDAAAEADRLAIEAFGEALAGSDRPFAIASGVIGLSPGRVATERDGLADEHPTPLPGGPQQRLRNALATLALASRGVRSSVLRFSPTVHGDGDHGFMAALIGIAREQGVSGYVDDGANRWPAVHRSDAAQLVRLAVEQCPAGSTLHAVAEEGVPIREVAEEIGRQLGLPVVSVPAAEAGAHFGWLGAFIGADSPVSSALTRELTGWKPTGPGLVEDLAQGHYFRTASA